MIASTDSYILHVLFAKPELDSAARWRRRRKTAFGVVHARRTPRSKWQRKLVQYAER
jgi:hypothetical protein